MKQYAALDDTVYFWFAANDTSGSGGDGTTPAADVRLAGAAADAAPVYSPTPVLLSHVNYPAGAYEIAIAATAANGFAANNTYAVFCTLAIDAQNPTGFVGSFDLKPIIADTDVSLLALEATLTAMKGSGWTDETLKAIKAALDVEVGSGALSCTWTQKDDDGNPMDNVQIWITTDEAGVNVIAGTLLTNASGEATFMLDAGTYYVWREKAGYNFTNPQTWVVS